MMIRPLPSRRFRSKTFKPLAKYIESSPGCSSTGNNRWVLQTAHISIYCSTLFYFISHLFVRLYKGFESSIEHSAGVKNQFFRIGQWRD
jgi:hypothetical protein